MQSKEQREREKEREMKTPSNTCATTHMPRYSMGVLDGEESHNGGKEYLKIYWPRTSQIGLKK